MKRYLHRSMRIAPVWAFAAVTAFWAAAAQAQVLSQVPADATIILKINKLGAVSDKAGVLAKQFGLVEMTPAAADPLSWLLSEGGLTNGVDKAGDAAMVFASSDFGAQPPPLLILLPVTDYKAFIGNFADAKKEGELDVFHFKGEDNENTYAANWGKYAALSPQKELLGKKPEGFKATGATAKELETKDAVVVVNLAVLGPKLDEHVKGAKDKILGDLEKNLGGDPKMGKYMPLIKAIVGQGINIADQFLNEAQYASFSVNLSKDGVATSFMMDFKDGSALGKAAASAQHTDASLLTGLPDAKYIFFGGGVAIGGSGRKVIEEWMAPIEAELAKAEDLKAAVTLLDAMKQMIKAHKSQTGGMIAPSGALGATPLIQTVAITVGDVKVLQEAQQKAMESQQQLMALIPNQPAMKTTFTPNAKTIDGVSFTQFTTVLPAEDNSPAAMQARQMLAMMYGPGGISGLTGALDDQHLLTASGLDDAMIQSAIKAVKENQDNLSKNEQIALVSKNLPQSRIAVAYFAVDQLVTTITNYAKMMGMPIPVNMKPNLGPIGFALATDGPAVKVDSFIPADLIEAMITTSLQLRMMGGGRGKPGGL